MKLPITAGVAFLVVACSSSTSSGPQTCDDYASAAQSELQDAISGNLSCNADTDCTTVDFSASCFDSCSRVTATSNKANVDAARTHANANSCMTFTQQGCKEVIPPCAPPSGASCNAGTCQ